MSLRLKLLLWYTGVLALSGGLLATTMYALVAHRMRSEVENDLEEEVAEWRAMTLHSLDDLPALRKQIRIEVDAEGHFPLAYRLHDLTTGRDLLYLMNEDIEHLREPLKSVAALDDTPDAVVSRARLGDERRPFRVITMVIDPARHPGLVVQVAQDILRLERREASMRRHLLLTPVSYTHLTLPTN